MITKTRMSELVQHLETFRSNHFTVLKREGVKKNKRLASAIHIHGRVRAGSLSTEPSTCLAVSFNMIIF